MTQYDLLGFAEGVVKAQNAEWFSSDLIPAYSGLVRIEISLSTAVVIEITFDSGANYTALNRNIALLVDSLYIFDVFCRAGDLLNFRIPTAGGATIDIGRIYQEG